MSMLKDIMPAAVLILGFLYGIRLMQSPRTALWGNRLGGASMALAVALTFWRFQLVGNPFAWACIVLGGAVGIARAQWARSIQMPQLVALLNGFGGAASALVIGAVLGQLQFIGGAAWFLSALTLGVGTLTFTGSMVAVLKLQGRLAPASVSFKGYGLLVQALLGLGVVMIAGAVVVRHPAMLYLVALTFAVYGLLMALRVGGADMPVLISFLNALSGVAASVSGITLDNYLAAGVGALVGVAGMILTQVMCRAMNRNLAAVLRGFKAAASQAPSQTTDEAAAGPVQTGKQAEAEDIPDILREARKVIIVPGYGMALAQAQQAVKNLADALERSGKEVCFAIHPVAGRMPGHMHVLLAEVGIDYDKLFDMAVINDAFADTDLVIAVGACDVINPAAATAEGTPIHGMPVLRVELARRVIVCNLDDQPGYSGVNNTLYDKSHVIGCWGNAAETVPALADAIREA